jgi:hypothetical protein
MVSGFPLARFPIHVFYIAGELNTCSCINTLTVHANGTDKKRILKEAPTYLLTTIVASLEREIVSRVVFYHL